MAGKENDLREWVLSRNTFWAKIGKEWWVMSYTPENTQPCDHWPFLWPACGHIR
jgi:hypothetical protein